jgi:hypothetical protein
MILLLSLLWRYSFRMMLNLDDAPEAPIERLLWLSGVMEAVKAELDAEFAEAYYEARLEGVFDTATGLGLHSKKRALAFTRAENERRGRTIRWNDGVDPTSTAFTG